MAAAFSLWATGLAISRAVHTARVSRMTRLFSRSVVPVAVRSTIASTSPVSGASSTEPLTSMISTWRRCARSALRRARVLGRDADHAEPAQSLGRPVGTRHRGDDHRAAAEAEVTQLVDLAAGTARGGVALLHQHVLTRDAYVRGAGGHVGRHV